MKGVEFLHHPGFQDSLPLDGEGGGLGFTWVWGSYTSTGDIDGRVIGMEL